MALAAAGALWLIFGTVPEVEREAAVRQTAMLVEVTRAEAGDFHPVIEAMGTVTPSREVMLSPRVGGEVVELAAEFVPGGFVRRGEVLLRIEDADYRNVVAQRESELEQAITELEIEHGRQDIAERDYRELQRELEPDKKALVLREPQLRSAEARVQAARTAVEQARLDLERTAVRAPFDAQVLARQVNLGSQVSTGDVLGRLVGIDTYWVETTVPLDKLRWLHFPDGPGDAGSPVTIRHRTAWGADQAREGRLFRLIGELEGDTRLARVLVEVEDPLARDTETRGAPGLIIGTFVECRIHGREIEDAVRLPRGHVRKGDTIWIMDGDQLAIRNVEIVFQDAEYAYIREGLSDRDAVVTTSLATVREGVKLRLKGGPEGGPEGGREAVTAAAETP
ncbi:MAG: efflux RND transporter periplasmic adaptor subunit [Xanthomonadales bacterium]|nr:efflux RND transporter periplasmic adaptor subunit [Xanthomonadales bacterium]